MEHPSRNGFSSWNIHLFQWVHCNDLTLITGIMVRIRGLVTYFHLPRYMGGYPNSWMAYNHGKGHQTAIKKLDDVGVALF